MALGRCSGCGRADSLRKISLHILSCPLYGELFAREPERCLDPAAENERYRAEENTPQARAEQRGERLHQRFSEINRQQAVSASRWARPPDILD